MGLYPHGGRKESRSLGIHSALEPIKLLSGALESRRTQAIEAARKRHVHASGHRNDSVRGRHETPRLGTYLYPPLSQAVLTERLAWPVPPAVAGGLGASQWEGA